MNPFPLARRLALASLLLCVCWGMPTAASPLHPGAAAHDTASSRSLNGSWVFKYVAGTDAGADERFTAPQFSVAQWARIAVPANWELHGFAEPRYGDELQAGLGLYRRSFQVPPAWQGQRIHVRFDGVAFGYTLWVNGVKVGQSTASAFNGHTFDITDAVAAHAGSEHVLAVRVETRPHGVEFDLNDDWSLSGIYRGVTLFAVPRLHLTDLATSTKLAADGMAQLSVSAALSVNGGAVRATLLAPHGRVAGRALLTQGADGRYTAQLDVAQPALWTAETPTLYRLQLTVFGAGGEGGEGVEGGEIKAVQSYEQRIGLREVRTEGAVLLLNGRPIKLRGVNHHDLDPLHGRAITEARMRADLLLMKRGNVNYVRTSHYPPDPRLLALCDELGMYVMDEVAIGHGESNLDKPDYRAGIMARVAATIARDKNHASVLIWSIGNENPITDVEMDAARLAKSLDPSRPITIPKVGSYFFANHARIPDFVDMHAPHYPVNQTLAGYARTLTRPTILTEYAHALGLATDRIQDQWDIIQASPVLAGGSIWHFMDQALMCTAPKPVERGMPTQLVWLDQYRYLDTHGLDGADGVTYGDRTPQTDFWQMRKVYAPVQLNVRGLGGAGAAEPVVDVENRHDFRALAGMTLHWAVQQNGRTIQRGQRPLRAQARQRESLAIAMTPIRRIHADVLALQVRVLDETGAQVNERTVRLDATASASLLSGSTSAPSQPRLTHSAATVRIDSGRWSLNVDRVSGALRIDDRRGMPLVAGMYPHIGRKQTMAEALSAPKRKLWHDSVLTVLEAVQVDARVDGDGVIVRVAGRFRHEVHHEQTLDGSYTLRVAADGTIAVSYDFALPSAAAAAAVLSEAGLSIMAPPALTEFRWVGQGPYAGYPGKDRLNDFGLFHLNRADLHFQGNRRGTDLALLTSATGHGVALATAPGDVAVERHGAQTLLSHNVRMAGLGNKGTSPETTLDLPAGARITGAFTLALLHGQWPRQLSRWFGKPEKASKVYAPFYHSYDQ